MDTQGDAFFFSFARARDADQPERIYQLDVDGLPSSFPPLRTHGEEPLDLEQRLERRINEYVEGVVERALANPSEIKVGSVGKLAAGGLLVALMSVAFLAALIVGVVVLVRWLV